MFSVLTKRKADSGDEIGHFYFFVSTVLAQVNFIKLDIEVLKNT